MGDFDLDEDPKPVQAPAVKRAPAPEPQRVRVSADVEPEYAEPQLEPAALIDPEPSAVTGLVPPHDLLAETATLSAIVLDPAALPMLLDFLKGEHFFSEANRIVFEACVWCYENGGTVDVVAVGDRLRRTDRLRMLENGMGYLARILNDSPAVVNVRKHAAIVYEHWRTRKIIENARHVLVSGYLGVEDVQAYADKATMAMGEIARRSVGARGMTNVEALKAILGKLEPRADGLPTKRGIPTGYRSIDMMTGGLHACETWYVIAQTGRGKTTMTQGVALHVALVLGIGVQVFCTETDKETWFQNAVCALAQVPNTIFQNPDERPPTELEVSRMVTAAGRLGDATWLHVDETREPSVDYMNAVVSARVNPTGQRVDGAPLGLVVLDHLHHTKEFVEARDDKAKPKAVFDATRKLSEAAKRFKLPYLIAAQSRNVETDRKTKVKPKPQSGMLSFSSQAENHADKVFVLQHPPLYIGGRCRGEDITRVTLYPTKGRRMVRREVEFQLLGAEGRLVDLDGEAMVAESRRQLDLRPEPAPRPVATTAAAAAAEPEPPDDEDPPAWYET